MNTTDKVTLFQVIVTLERISEEFMLPGLKKMLADLPFKIMDFMLTTVVNISITVRLNYWKSCEFNLPSHDHGAAKIMV